MVVSALRAAIPFLTRLPIEPQDGDWDAFRRSPWAFPVVGYLVGIIAGTTAFAPMPTPAKAASYVVLIYLLTGVNHADGLADLGDAAAVHGADERRAVLKDSMLGVGGALTLVVVVVGLAFTAASAFDATPLGVVGLVVAAEVGAKLGMAVLACVGTPAHEGIGSEFTVNTPRALIAPVVVCLPILLTGTTALALLGGPVVALALRRWTRDWLGGINGDVFGATNELGRFAGLLLGVVAWTVW